jgi:hypothetical protein
MILIIAFAVGVLAYFIVQQRNRRKEQQPDKLELQRKASLDDILKNNKDRYVG